MHRTALRHPAASRSSRSSPKPQSGLAEGKKKKRERRFDHVGCFTASGCGGRHSPDSLWSNALKEQSHQTQAFIPFVNTRKYDIRSIIKKIVKLTQFYLMGHSRLSAGYLWTTRSVWSRKKPGGVSQKLVLNVVCVVFLSPCLRATRHAFLHFVPQFFRKEQGDFFIGCLFLTELSTPFVSLGKILIQVRRPEPQHSQPAQQLHCFGWWFYMKMPHFCTFLHCIASRSNVRTLPGSPKVLFLFFNHQLTCCEYLFLDCRLSPSIIQVHVLPVAKKRSIKQKATAVASESVCSCPTQHLYLHIQPLPLRLACGIQWSQSTTWVQLIAETWWQQEGNAIYSLCCQKRCPLLVSSDSRNSAEPQLCPTGCLLLLLFTRIRTPRTWTWTCEMEKGWSVQQRVQFDLCHDWLIDWWREIAAVWLISISSPIGR